MPYGNQSDPDKKREWDALHQLICEVAENLPRPSGESLQCIRGDHEKHPGEIITGIVRDLEQSDIAIAVLTGQNANVFYELGVRHALANRTLLLAQNEADIPFDLRTQRMLLFSTDGLVGYQKFRSDLRNSLLAIVGQPSDLPDNPVQRYLANRNSARQHPVNAKPLREDQNSTIKELTDVVSELVNLLRAGGNVDFPMSHDLGFKGICGAVENGFCCDPVEDLSWLEGCWLNEESGTHAYAMQTISGICGIYCYGGDTEATGVYEKFQRYGSRIFARFHWLNDPTIRGLTVLRVEDHQNLVGGWWFDDYVKGMALQQFDQIDERHPGMVPCRWRKLKNKLTPSWATAELEKLRD